MSNESFDEYATAATGAQRLLSNHNLPMLDPHSDTCFSNVRWNSVLAYNVGSILTLYQTVNGRHWAAVEARVEEAGMYYRTYLGIARHASAALFSGIHPETSAAWQRHNAIYAPKIERDPSAVMMHVGAAVGIMSRQGDVGRQRPPLRPVTAVHTREAMPTGMPFIAYRLARSETTELAITTTAHLRDDTTSTSAFRAPDIQAAQAYLRPGEPMPHWPDGYVSLSMFGRPTPASQGYLERLLASAAYTIQA